MSILISTDINAREEYAFLVRARYINSEHQHIKMRKTDDLGISLLGGRKKRAVTNTGYANVCGKS